MSQVERTCEEMSKYLEETAHSVMSTSESEQSLSERTAVCPPNRALIFMKHNSSDYEETEERQKMCDVQMSNVRSDRAGSFF